MTFNLVTFMFVLLQLCYVISVLWLFIIYTIDKSALFMCYLKCQE